MATKTELKITKSNDLISHKDKLVLLGSCFSDNIGKLLKKYRFQVQYNPLGIIYNPHTLSKIIGLAVQEKSIHQDHIKQLNDVYCHFDFHSKYSSLKKEKVYTKINEDLAHLKSYISSSQFIFLTLGTAMTHVWKDNTEIVGNCHKFPADHFIKKMLSVEEITHTLNTIIKNLRACNPTIKIIFTLSPVRHVKDGIIENATSKARLMTAISEIRSDSPDIAYFPSFEIMNDELRDYSYYKKDLVHPNKRAIKHIWNTFENTHFSQQTIELNKKLRRILVSSKHKAFHPKSQEHQKFLKQLIKQIDTLEVEENGIQLATIRKKVLKQIV